MTFVFFSCITPEGEYVKRGLGGPDIDFCLDTLSSLVGAGWQLVNIRLGEHPGNSKIELPIEAFDGEPMSAQLAGLRRTWKRLLGNPDYHKAIAAYNCAIELQTRSAKRRDHNRIRLINLFKKMDAIQARIEEDKEKWGVV